MCLFFLDSSYKALFYASECLLVPCMCNQQKEGGGFPRIQIESCHVRAENRTHVLCKRSKCFSPLTSKILLNCLECFKMKAKSVAPFTATVNLTLLKMNRTKADRQNTQHEDKPTTKLGVVRTA